MQMFIGMALTRVVRMLALQSKRCWFVLPLIWMRLSYLVVSGMLNSNSLTSIFSLPEPKAHG